MMDDIYDIMNGLLLKKENFVLATILEKYGPAPREEGTKMLVKRDFAIGGTIGGGLLEAMSVKMSSKVFENGQYITENFDLSGNRVIPLGMLCRGDIKLLLEYVDCSDKEMVEHYKKALELKKESMDFVAVTRLSEHKRRIAGTDKWICTETGVYGVEDEEAWSIIRNIRENFSDMKIHVINQGTDKYLVEPYFHYECACIIGGGHVAQIIAQITKMLGFYTIVIDDREEFANRGRFKDADEVKAIPSFVYLQDHVRINHNSYVIIVTRGHVYDIEVLEQILKTDAKYIGMIGSMGKKELVFRAMLEEGFTLEDLARISCPIGIPIHAQTPEEIAVSIAAELIRVKREPR